MAKKKDVTTTSTTTDTSTVVAPQASDFNDLYANLKSYFMSTMGGIFNIAMVPTLTRYAMECIETGLEWKQMTATEKSNLIVGVVVQFTKDIISDTSVTKNLDANTRAAILASLDLVPIIINVATDFANTVNSTSSTTTPTCGCF